MAELKLPDGILACLFDMDGVLTRTASVHAKAWKEAFDAFLARRDGDDFTPFDIAQDYTAHVDGKPREDGVRDFLASREITVPDGSAEDGPQDDTVAGIGNAKNAKLLEVLERDGVDVFEPSIAFVRAARENGLRTAVVSSSKNTVAALEAAGILDLFEARVDGNTLAEHDIRGKPAPDAFLLAAERLGVAASAAAVFEDALSGVEAGRAGNFGYVVGVDQAHQADALRDHGADIVVTEDLGELMA
jgi:beta-phosphoglucomutase family hydrolase